MLARGNKDLSLLDGMTGSALEISKGYVQTFINSGENTSADILLWNLI